MNEESVVDSDGGENPNAVRSSASARPFTDADVIARISARLRPSERRDLLVYVHVPFCSSKCHFCDWVAGITVGQLLAGADVRGRYAEAVCDQINCYGPRLLGLGYRPRLLYWGGGTPSRLDAEHISLIGRTLRDVLGLEGVREYTVEMSPETVELDKLAAFKSVGMNRVSLGVQSFDDDVLRRAGRSHRGAEAEQAVALIREAGIGNFNVDLMFGMPDQDAAKFETSVQKAAELSVPHITLYPYRPDPRTVMAMQIVRGYRNSDRNSDLVGLYRSAKSNLERRGYLERTVGYFATAAELHCVAEEYYFGLRGDYFGFGSGAKSVMAGYALGNEAAGLAAYIADPTSFQTCEGFSPTKLDEIVPTLLRGLWLPEGIDFDAFEAFFGYPLAVVRDHQTLRQARDFYRYCGASFRETERRLFVSEETRAVANINYITSAYGARLMHDRARARVASVRAPRSQPTPTVS